MSQIVRLFLSGLNTHTQLREMSSNLGCLPDPRPVEWKYYVYVFGIYGAVLLLIIMDAYALRLRRVTASFFFRKREKQRVLYLYNMLMKKRNCFLLDMRRKVKKKAKQMKLGKRSTLMYALGRVLPFMRLCKSARGTCLICGEKENFSFAKCTTPRCNCVYCRECWEDIKEKCYACLPLTEFSSTDTDDTDSSADDEI
ncbi:hypothetical protein DPMN_170425 [Dreissena polymorpha]|uniref:Dendritic cell-specific transmembrane protein-like domain-containing protein n=2 Tax=Dreissena polymorpha TaxID=45954 RepID=A0A9D4IBI5_DREPO|nr:hypothetical protein DPMN_170425 [Dreissena polymorpha]